MPGLNTCRCQQEFQAGSIVGVRRDAGGQKHHSGKDLSETAHHDLLFDDKT
jgi:hypothetical protein